MRIGIALWDLGCARSGMCWMCLWGVPSAGETVFGLNVDFFGAYRITKWNKTDEGKTATAHISDTIIPTQCVEFSGSGLGLGLENGFRFLSTLSSLFDVIYDNLCSVNVAGRLADRCLSLRLRSTDAGCLYKLPDQTQDFYRESPPQPQPNSRPVHPTRRASLSVFGDLHCIWHRQPRVRVMFINGGCCIYNWSPIAWFAWSAANQKRPIDRMFYGCQIQLLQYSKWFAPSCASPFFSGHIKYVHCTNEIVYTRIPRKDCPSSPKSKKYI